jgi:ankyrin repeat protein
LLNINTVDVLATMRTKRDIENRLAIQLLTANGGEVLAQLLVEEELYNLDKRTPIMYAVTHEAMFDELLQRDDVDLLYKDRRERNILAHAVSGGNAVCVERLLARPGIEINARDHLGRSPLATAIRSRRRDPQVVRLLLAMDEIEINRGDVKGCTPLHWAISKSDEITKLLLADPRINVNQSDHVGCTPLMTAVEKRDNLRGLTMLLDHPQILVDQEDDQGRTALWHAICLGHEEAIHLILQKGSQEIEYVHA